MTGMAGGGGGGGGGFNYVQNGYPADAAEGEELYHTGNDAAYVYDGVDWVQMTVVDHGQLSGIGAADHHTRPTGTSYPTDYANIWPIRHGRNGGPAWWDDDTSTSDTTGISAGTTVLKVTDAELETYTIAGCDFNLMAGFDITADRFGVIYADATEEWLDTTVSGGTWERAILPTPSKVSGWKAEFTYGGGGASTESAGFKEVQPVPTHTHTI